MTRHQPPGRLIDAGGFRLHLNMSGERKPLVVFDAALGASSLSWVFVQPRVAEFARTCTCDRAGFAWSDAGPLPRTVGRAADELRRALDRAGETPPFLLVGHSYGGLVMRTLAGRYRSDVAGLVLVDPAHPEDWIDPAPKEQVRIDRGVYLCRQARLASRIGLAQVVSGLVKVGAIPVARRIVNMVSRSRLDTDIDWMLAPFLKLPDDVRHQVRQFWTQPKFFEALGSQIGSMRQSAHETLAAAPDGYGDLPLVTITKSEPDAHRLRRQEAVAQLSTRGRHIVASRAGHWIPLDEPEIIVDVIAGMHGAVRDAERPATRRVNLAPTPS